jgi:Peptidase family M28
MRPLILDLDHSILDLPGGRLSPGGRELLRALAAAGVPLALLTVADPERRAEKADALAAVLRREGLDDAASRLAGRLVAVKVAAGDETAARRQYEEGLRAAAASCSGAEEDHAHMAVLLSRDPSHLDIARAAGLLAYPLGGDATAKADTAYDGRADAAADLVETLRWHPCDKRRAAAKGRLASTAAKRKAADPGIAGLVTGVSEARLKAMMEGLVAWGTRWTFAPHIDQVTAAIREAFVSAGYPATAARFQPFSMPGSASQRNVLCGSATPGDGVILLCAHYDSISRNPAAAPGCDDNASGIAVMLEAARVLRDAGLDRHVLCAAFGGEEQGLYGSRACAEISAAEGWDIRLVINLDMVGYRDPARPDLVTVEFDQGNAQPGNDAAARGHAMTMAQAAADYTLLQVEHTDIWNSDYMPFEAKGYACIGLYDGAADAPFYHSTEDTLDKVDLARIAEVTRLVVATVATIARPASAAA